MARQKLVTEAEIKRCISELNTVVSKHCHGSTLRGLDVTASAFGCLLDIYARPNAENPQGMCDDPEAFRRLYADYIANGRPDQSNAEPKPISQQR